MSRSRSDNVTKGRHQNRKSRKFESKKTEMSQIQFGNFENRGGGLNFSKMSQVQLFDSVVCVGVEPLLLSDLWDIFEFQTFLKNVDPPL